MALVLEQSSIQFSQDGSAIAVGTASGQLRVYSLDTMRQIHDFSGASLRCSLHLKYPKNKIAGMMIPSLVPFSGIKNHRLRRCHAISPGFSGQYRDLELSS